MKPGAKTTEGQLTFIKALVGPVLAILVVLGVGNVPTEDAVMDAVNRCASAVIAAVGLFVSGRVVTGYTDARTHLKVNGPDARPPEVGASVIGFETIADDEEDVDANYIDAEGPKPMGMTGNNR